MVMEARREVIGKNPKKSHREGSKKSEVVNRVKVVFIEKRRREWKLKRELGSLTCYAVEMVALLSEPGIELFAPVF